MNEPGGAHFPASLLLVGAGRMGGALLRGWLDLGLEARRLHVVEPQPSAQMRELCAARGVHLGLLDVDAAQLETARAELVPSGVHVHCRPVDICDR